MYRGHDEFGPRKNSDAMFRKAPVLIPVSRSWVEPTEQIEQAKEKCRMRQFILFVMMIILFFTYRALTAYRGAPKSPWEQVVDGFAKGLRRVFTT
jgi:hypothetical protein